MHKKKILIASITSASIVAGSLAIILPIALIQKYKSNEDKIINELNAKLIKIKQIESNLNADNIQNARLELQNAQNFYRDIAKKASTFSGKSKEQYLKASSELTTIISSLENKINSLSRINKDTNMQNPLEQSNDSNTGQSDEQQNSQEQNNNSNKNQSDKQQNSQEQNNNSNTSQSDKQHNSQEQNNNSNKNQNDAQNPQETPNHNDSPKNDNNKTDETNEKNDDKSKRESQNLHQEALNEINKLFDEQEKTKLLNKINKQCATDQDFKDAKNEVISILEKSKSDILAKLEEIDDDPQEKEKILNKLEQKNLTQKDYLGINSEINTYIYNIKDSDDSVGAKIQKIKSQEYTDKLFAELDMFPKTSNYKFVGEKAKIYLILEQLPTEQQKDIVSKLDKINYKTDNAYEKLKEIEAIIDKGKISKQSQS